MTKKQLRALRMTEEQLNKYADVLIWGISTARRSKYKAYDPILLRYDDAALPLAEILQRKLLEERFHVITRSLGSPELEKNFYAVTDRKQRQFIPPGTEELYNKLTGSILLSAPESLTHLESIESSRLGEAAVARKKLRDILDLRENKGQFGWTLCTLPTRELAKKAGLSLKKYADQIVRACFLDDPDPVGRWQQIWQDSMEIKKFLNKLPITKLHIESSSTDLEIQLGEKRQFIGISGHNIPSFEIFTSPDWRNARGVYCADQPSYRNGNLVKGVRLEFDKGKVIKATADKGEKFLNEMIAMDSGAGAIGEFSLTDKRFSPIDRFMADTLFDENFGGEWGNCHIAVGASYADTFSGNPAKLDKAAKKQLGFNESALHWDLVNTEQKRVTATLKNGKTRTVYENGQFCL